MYVDIARTAFAFLLGRDTDPNDFSDNLAEFGRRARDFGGIDPRLEGGALNYTLLYLVMGHDDAGGRIALHPLTKEGQVRWPGVGDQAIFRRMNDLQLAHATVLGSTYIENPLWGFTPARTLTTVHPLGGCPMGEDAARGLVNDRGQVYDEQGNLHEGLHVADGSIVPTSIGVNPFLTISALSERIADQLITGLGGTPHVIGHI